MFTRLTYTGHVPLWIQNWYTKMDWNQWKKVIYCYMWVVFFLALLKEYLVHVFFNDLLLFCFHFTCLVIWCLTSLTLHFSFYSLLPVKKSFFRFFFLGNMSYHIKTVKVNFSRLLVIQVSLTFYSLLLWSIYSSFMYWWESNRQASCLFFIYFNFMHCMFSMSLVLIRYCHMDETLT